MSSVHVLSNTYFMNTDDSNMIQLRTAGRLKDLDLQKTLSLPHAHEY